MNKFKILDVIAEQVGLFKDIFWEDTEKIIYNREREQAKILLIDVYWYDAKEVQTMWPSEIDEKKLDSVLEKLFRFSGSQPINNNNNDNIW